MPVNPSALLPRFQSTLPVGGGTDYHQPETPLNRISIHPPRGGRD